MQKLAAALLVALIIGSIAVVFLRKDDPKVVKSVNSATPTTAVVEVVREEKRSGDAGVPPTKLDYASLSAELQQVLTGGPVPALPKDAPNMVSFGVVLLVHEEALAAPSGAPKKAAAYEKARTLMDEARHDFDEAVKKGDVGSVAKAGKMPRGILEPPLEYVLYTLKKGEVFPEPLDTPRGFWILRRTD
jgi:hypothetical protein